MITQSTQEPAPTMYSEESRFQVRHQERDSRQFAPPVVITLALMVLAIGVAACGGSASTGSKNNAALASSGSSASSYSQADLTAIIKNCFKPRLMMPFRGSLKYQGSELVSGGTLAWTVYEDILTPGQIAAITLFQTAGEASDAADQAAQNSPYVFVHSDGSPWGIYGPEEVDSSDPAAASIAVINSMLPPLEACLAKHTDVSRIPRDRMQQNS